MGICTGTADRAGRTTKTYVEDQAGGVTKELAGNGGAAIR